jgi:hypothetical protein
MASPVRYVGIDVNPMDVGLPAKTTRPVSKAHVRALYNEFNVNDYKPSLGRITLLRVPAAATAAAAGDSSEIVEAAGPSPKYTVVDGMHRISALRMFEGKDPRFFSVPMVVLESAATSGSGGSALLTSQVLTIASKLNVSSNIVAATTLRDKIHITISYLESLHDEGAIDLATTPSDSELGRRIEGTRLLGPDKSAVCLRVAKVALALRVVPAARDLFNKVAEHRSNGGIRLENMATLAFLHASERNKCIMLQALYRRFNNAARNAGGGEQASDDDDEDDDVVGVYETRMSPPVPGTLKAPLDRLFFEMVTSLAELITSTDPMYYKSGKFVKDLYQYTDMWNPSPDFTRTPTYAAQLKNLVLHFGVQIAGKAELLGNEGLLLTHIGPYSGSPDEDIVTKEKVDALVKSLNSQLGISAPSGLANRGTTSTPPPGLLPVPGDASTTRSSPSQTPPSAAAAAASQAEQSGTSRDQVSAEHRSEPVPEEIDLTKTTSAGGAVGSAAGGAGAAGGAKEAAGGDLEAQQAGAGSSAGPGACADAGSGGAGVTAVPPKQSAGPELRRREGNVENAAKAARSSSGDQMTGKKRKRANSQKKKQKSKKKTSKSKKRQSSSSSSSDDDDENENALNPFDDEQENPEPLHPVDADMGNMLPFPVRSTRSRFYLTIDVFQSLMAEIIARASRIMKEEKKTPSMASSTGSSGGPGELLFTPSSEADARAYSAQLYFTAAKQSLSDKGYVILADLIKDTEVANDLKSVFSHFKSRFNHDKDDIEDPWVHIWNQGQDESDTYMKNTRTGRFSIGRKDLADELEVQAKHLYVRKLKVEVVLGRILELLDSKPSELRFPATGSRLLLTVGASRTDCPPQKPHIDFTLTDRKDPGMWCPRDHPDYFMMVSEDQPFPLYVWPYSHVMTGGSDDKVRRLCRNVPPLKVQVPPYSVFVGRGDLFHAGASAADTNTTGQDSNIRLHLYAARNPSAFKDAAFLYHEKYPFHFHTS